ncbi:GlsB/YeaQ/YmgE family stress response membrane protein [Candidatus Saccharibacteria bacterium]|nr:GlsB/YeaQ/YmgE family stress response membrane protein [Candidatus Saccharibacteria bacterium]
MGIILWLIFGALAGWIASKIMNTDAEQGAVANIVVGVIGAMIGGFVFSTVGGQSVTGFNIYSLVVAVIGAVILLAIVKAFRK